MSDQAFKLRRLAGTALPEAVADALGPTMVVVAGGKAAVGATTVAVNLAAALADGGERVVLVDAAQRAPHVAEVSGATKAVERSLADVIAGTCSAAEALAPGPCGCLLLANRRGERTNVGFSRHAQQRLFGELHSLGKLASLLVIDAGCGLTAWTRRFWLRAGLVLLVTTTDDRALMESYALIKRSVADGIKTKIRVLANQCDREISAQKVCRRLSAACQRFLGHSVQSVPALPRLAIDPSQRRNVHARVWESANTPFGHGVLWLGRSVSDVLAKELQRAGCGGQALENERSIQH